MQGLTENQIIPVVEHKGFSENAAIFNTDDDPVCWRCGAPDSEHSWYGGRTYCKSAWDKEDEGRLDFTQTFQLFPSEISDEELVCRESFLRDTRDWML